MIRWMLLIAIAGIGVSLAHAQPSAAEVLGRSQAYHDPDMRWAQVRHELDLRETRPDRPDRQTTLVIDWAASVFEITRATDDGPATGRLEGETCVVDAPSAGAAPFRCEEAGDGRPVAFWRDYYGYLYSLPMNLADAGTHLDPEVQATTFNDQDVFALKVTYAADVGGDTWYFYVDPESYALVGCRFYHDEAANDGEYLIFEGEVEAGGLRLPRTRAWYINRDGRYLGSDTIEVYRVE